MSGALNQNLIEQSKHYVNKNNVQIEPGLFDCIDKVMYINLDSRTDRKQEIEQQFKNVNLEPHKIERMRAVPHKLGALGCSASHIKCIRRAKEQGWKNVLILEDDFNFIGNLDIFKHNLQHISHMGNEWDVLLFSANVLQVDAHNGILYKAMNVQSTSGYLVNSHYYDTLLRNFLEGYFKLSKNYIRSQFAIDMYWKLLQPKDKWYIFKNKMGYQRASYSNIENRLVDYTC